jgi:hypothetical protein
MRISSLLNGSPGLDSFEQGFLSHNLGLALLGQAAKRPWTWPEIIGPAANRAQFMVDNFNAGLLATHTGKPLRFGDLSAKAPFGLFGSTDYSAERHFEFTQDSFNDICSDLASYPLADAVAASGAFPLLLPSENRRRGASAPFRE